MNYRQSFGNIKAAARRGLENNYGYAIVLLIQLQMLNILLPYLILVFLPGNSLLEIITFEIVGLILTALLQILQMGSCYFYLKLNCGQTASVSDLYYGFRTNRNQALGIGLVYALVSYLCLLPYTYFSYCATYAGRVTDVRFLFLLLLAGQLAEFLLLIPVSQSYYILLDFPDYTAKQALLISFRMMKGNLLRYLLFALSFIPLFLLSLLCCGLGLLWVVPYMESSLAVFYLDLAAYNNQKNQEAPQGA